MAFQNNDFKPSPPLYGGRYRASGFVQNVAPPIKIGSEERKKPWKYKLNQNEGQNAAAPQQPAHLMDTGPDDNNQNSIENYDRNRRIAQADQYGYDVGQGSIGGLIGTAAGFLTGVPGLGFVGEKITDSLPESPRTVTREDGSTYTDARSIDYGAVGTRDHDGNVFGNDGRAYDPITGRPANSYANRGAAFDHIFGDATPEVSQEARDLGVSEGSVAGIRTKKGDDSIQALLDDAAKADAAGVPDHIGIAAPAPPPVTATGGTDLRGKTYEQTDARGARPSEVIGQTSGGDDVYRPTGGGTVVTDRHGNAVTSTNQQGQKVAVTSRPQPEPQREDSGGGGGGGGGK